MCLLLQNKKSEMRKYKYSVFNLIRWLLQVPYLKEDLIKISNIKTFLRLGLYEKRGLYLKCAVQFH